MKQLKIYFYTSVLILTLGGCIFKASQEKAIDNSRKDIVITRTDPWILIDSLADNLIVMSGSKIIKTYDNVAFGVAGVGKKKKKGDGITPIGTFHISSIRRSDKFRYFMQLSYPSYEYVKWALNDGMINNALFKSIESRILAGKLPPQDTVLGGYIGIHGVGKGSLRTHQDINWTDGCIALTNDQIDDLVKVIKPGVLVEIR